LDGLRLITVVKDGEIKFYTRTKQEFKSLAVLEKAISDNIRTKFGTSGYVLDGELYTINSAGEPNFKLSMAALKHTEQMAEPRYKVFDALSYEEYFNGIINPKFSERIARVAFTENAYVSLLEQRPWSLDAFNEMKKISAEGKWEGLMVRFDVPWESTRSWTLLKYKYGESEEFKVTGITILPMPFPNASGGEDVKMALKNITIKFEGNDVDVGSGFTTEERLAFAASPDDINGKIVSINYQEVTTNKKTKLKSLRCPIFKGLIGEKRDF
jgi:DNA ligase-1